MEKSPSKTSIFSTDTKSTSSTIQSNFQWKTNSISIQEIILYILCLVIICAISFGRTNNSTYYFTSMLMKVFVTSGTDEANAFNDIAQNNGEDFWKALQGPIFSRLYDVITIESDIPKSDYGYIYNENKILGVARLRQVRVKPNSCELHKEFAKRNFTQGCYAAYTMTKEDHDSFGNKSLNVFTSKAWHYTPIEWTKTSVHTGVVSEYGGGGYVQLFTRDAKTTMEILRELERNLWINRGTRAIFFDAIVYNPNINLFCHIRLLAEYPSSGGAIPSTSIRAVKLIRYTSPIDYLTLICEIIFILLLIFQIIEFLIEIVDKKLSFLFNIWNIINLITIILSFICILYEILSHFSTNKYLGDLLQIENNYPNFDELFTLKINSDFSLGLTLGLNWLKLFKYLNINKTMLLLNKTISSSLNEIFAFACIFLIIFLAYTHLGWLLFGGYLSEWRSFRTSIFTLFRIILGDFDLDAMRNIGRIIGPLFLFSYIYFVYFVLLNMFLAIINETYSRIESDSTLQTFEIQNFSMIFYRLFSRKKKSVDYETNLKIRGYTDHEIRTIVKKYDKNNDGKLDEDEEKTLKHDLETGQIKINENNDNNKSGNYKSERFAKRIEYVLRTQLRYINSKLSYDEYLELDQHVDEIERKASNFVDKIEQVLTNLDSLHRTTINRQQVLTNIFINGS